MHFKSKATNPYSRDDVHLLPDERPEAFSSIVLHLLLQLFIHRKYCEHENEEEMLCFSVNRVRPRALSCECVCV